MCLSGGNWKVAQVRTCWRVAVNRSRLFMAFFCSIKIFTALPVPRVCTKLQQAVIRYGPDQQNAFSWKPLKGGSAHRNLSLSNFMVGVFLDIHSERKEISPTF